MERHDLAISIGIMFICAVSWMPMIRNFRSAIAKEQGRVSPVMRIAIISWIGLALTAIPFVFFTLAYSVGLSLGVFN